MQNTSGFNRAREVAAAFENPLVRAVLQNDDELPRLLSRAVRHDNVPKDLDFVVSLAVINARPHSLLALAGVTDITRDVYEFSLRTHGEAHEVTRIAAEYMVLPVEELLAAARGESVDAAGNCTIPIEKLSRDLEKLDYMSPKFLNKYVSGQYGAPQIDSLEWLLQNGAKYNDDTVRVAALAGFHTACEQLIAAGAPVAWSAICSVIFERTGELARKVSEKINHHAHEELHEFIGDGDREVLKFFEGLGYNWQLECLVRVVPVNTTPHEFVNKSLIKPAGEHKSDEDSSDSASESESSSDSSSFESSNEVCKRTVSGGHDNESTAR